VGSVKRDKILTTAEGLINGDRADIYGPAIKNFERIGILWGVMLGTDPVPPATVGIMLVQLKAARLFQTPDHLDSWVDLAGYAALAGEIATSSDAEAGS
jgi:hypothetical protein